jgi:DNA-binding MarR family transcriptional regulator
MVPLRHALADARRRGADIAPFDPVEEGIPSGSCPFEGSCTVNDSEFPGSIAACLVDLSRENPRSLSVVRRISAGTFTESTSLGYDDSLESRDLVRREPDPADGRFTNAILTDTGYAKLVASAPAHVATVRSLVIDAFSAAELRQLREALQHLLARIETSK